MGAMSSSTAIFAAADLEETLAYYHDVLGFEIAWKWGEPASIAGIRLGGIDLMISFSPDLAARIAGQSHWFNVDDVDELYGLHQSRGARIVSEIADRPWGFREYVVEDPNGYVLRFTGPLTSQQTPSKPFPDGVTLENRKPTTDEYLAITGEVTGHREELPDILERSWGGVIARTTEGETIGVLRIMWDAPGWFSIWDVAVLPQWQGQNIGSAMMKRGQQLIREASPGAFVYLFTSKHGFYERLGFETKQVTMRRV